MQYKARKDVWLEAIDLKEIREGTDSFPQARVVIILRGPRDELLRARSNLHAAHSVATRRRPDTPPTNILLEGEKEGTPYLAIESFRDAQQGPKELLDFVHKVTRCDLGVEVEHNDDHRITLLTGYDAENAGDADFRARGLAEHVCGELGIGEGRLVR